MDSLGAGRIPIGGMIEITERCNLSCLHCFINQAVCNKVARGSELSTKEISDILDEIANAGCLFLTLTGGEPLIRPDFSEIYLYARGKGMLVTLFTNGTMITPQIADTLATSPPQLVDISLYGATKETYERVTQVKGSFDRCLRGIKLLLQRGIKVGIKAVLMTVNQHELPQIQNMAAELGIKFRYDGTIWPRTDGDEEAYQFRLSIEEMLAMDRKDPERYNEWQKRAEEFKNAEVRNEFIFNCGAGLRTFHINSTGYLSPCIMLRKPSYNLKTMEFNDAWEKIGEIRKWKRQRHTMCETCSAGALCAQCPGWSMIVHGDYETPVDYICQLGKARAGQFTTINL